MTAKQLEYAVFCIESTAERLGIDGRQAYRLLAVRSSMLDDYIVPNFDVLHTQSKEYVVDGIVERLKGQGVL